MAYILPDPTPVVLQDEELDKLFTRMIRGVTGIDGQLVRPRWQPEPPNQPDYNVAWAAMGITKSDDDRNVFKRQVDALTMELEYDQVLSVLVSFYGPRAGEMAALFKDGLQVDQNRVELKSQRVKLTECQEARKLPALFKEKWLKRIDVASTWRRRVTRRYSVGSFLSAGISLDNEHYITPIQVAPPPVPRPYYLLDESGAKLTDEGGQPLTGTL